MIEGVDAGGDAVGGCRASEHDTGFVGFAGDEMKEIAEGFDVVVDLLELVVVGGVGD